MKNDVEVSNTSPDSEAAKSYVNDTLTQALLPIPKQSPPVGEQIASLVDKILTGELSSEMLQTKGDQTVDRAFKKCSSHLCRDCLLLQSLLTIC